MPDYNWPADMVDSTKIYELLGFKSADPKIVASSDMDRIRMAERAVELARTSGRLKRLTAKNAQTGEITAYGYRRADVLKVLNIA